MTSITLLSAPGCSGCRRTKEMVRRLADEFGIPIEEIDITEHPEVVAEYNVTASPGIVIDGKLAFSGNVSEKDVRGKLEEVRKQHNELTI